MLNFLAPSKVKTFGRGRKLQFFDKQQRKFAQIFYFAYKLPLNRCFSDLNFVPWMQSFRQSRNFFRQTKIGGGSCSCSSFASLATTSLG